MSGKFAQREVSVTRLVRIVLFLVAGWGIVAPGQVWCQSWPARPIKIVVPFPPGNGTDILARLMTPKLSRDLGQPVIVENRGGANGMIGADAVARAAPDGYMILFTSPSTHVTAQFLTGLELRVILQEAGKLLARFHPLQGRL